MDEPFPRGMRDESGGTGATGVLAGTPRPAVANRAEIRPVDGPVVGPGPFVPVSPSTRARGAADTGAPVTPARPELSHGAARAVTVKDAASC